MVRWITGHSYVVYGPLANGATTVMFESLPTYPNASRYWYEFHTKVICSAKSTQGISRKAKDKQFLHSSHSNSNTNEVRLPVMKTW